MKLDYASEYSRLHESYPKFFAGFTLKKYVNDIEQIVKEHKPSVMLDYGCGKGYQYLKMRMHERWGGLLPHCYDVGVRQLAERPTIIFDGLICTDMLEHIDQEDVPFILNDIFSLISKAPSVSAFAFLGISCIPEKRDVKKLSDGRGVHVTVQQPSWWRSQIECALAIERGNKPITIYCVYETATETVRDTIG